MQGVLSAKQMKVLKVSERESWKALVFTLFVHVLHLISVSNVQGGKIKHFFAVLKGCGMGAWLVLVSPCFRENVVATCKIGSFLCSLDNLLQKNVIVLFFGNQISKWRSFEKGAIFDLLFTFSSHQGKVTNFLQHISHSHSYTYFAHPIDFFYRTNSEKIRIYQVRFLFGMSPGVDSYSRHFGTINK